MLWLLRAVFQLKIYIYYQFYVTDACMYTVHMTKLWNVWAFPLMQQRPDTVMHQMSINRINFTKILRIIQPQKCI